MCSTTVTSVLTKVPVNGVSGSGDDTDLTPTEETAPQQDQAPTHPCDSDSDSEDIIPVSHIKVF